MKTTLYISILAALLLCPLAWGKVSHVSINQQQFNLGASPRLKVNIVTDTKFDKLQFVVEQRAGNERLMVNPINSFMLLLSGVEDVSDPDAQLVIKEYRVNRWYDVKRLALFSGKTIAVAPSEQNLKAPVQAQSNPAATGGAELKPNLASEAMVDTGCMLDYSGKQTLWRLGSRYGGVWQLNTYGAILAIFDANPKAFSGGDINRLRADAKLACPSEALKQGYRDAKLARQIFESK
ncbi:hypothetical protein [Shewanella colwelliana]|uniref:type IV pilus assembly protein FimV n=1 Tax=Shewanella colwelliana TaxID=23 RepID=UPI00299EDDFD|nr:hypothetical protein [Shewanella colwelliana]MDX1280132.1 hypothetical protein [Shewanella colwelliana]